MDSRTAGHDERQRRRFLGRAGAVLLAGAALLAGCERPGEPPRPHVVHKVQGRVFGAPVEVSIWGLPEADAKRHGDEVLAEWQRLHDKFHAWKPSALTALNEAIARGEAYQADQEMVDILRAATRLAEDSGHTFNPAIGRLIRLWGFQTSQIEARGPAPEEIRKLVDARPRMSDLVFDGTRISSRNPVVMLDLGGYAKGYALDRAARILRGHRVPAALINVGGNILALGQPGERPWRVGIQDPRGEGLMAGVDLRDNEAIGTSGDYQRYFMKDGKRHGHIIDPHTGQTTDTVAAVTVIVRGGSDVGTRSDGHTKPLFVVGPAQWQAMAERLGLKEVLLIDTKRTVHMTPAMAERLSR